MRLHFIKQLLCAALLGGMTVGAQADDPAAGATLYANNCTTSNCHSATPLTNNSKKIYNGRNARSVIDAAISSVKEMNTPALRSAFPSGGASLANVAAYLGNTPAVLGFAATNVGSTALAQTVTVYASLKSGNSISGLTISTTGDFARSGGSCGTSLGTGLSCTVLVNFTPTAAGTRSGTLSISHNNTLTPIAIALSGTGVSVGAPVASITPSAVTLTDTAIGSTSAAQSVNVANTGNAALSLTSISLSNASDFVIAGGTCAAGGSVAAGSSCTVSVAFKPSAGAAGARAGTLSIAHNATGSPGAVSLSGNALAAPAPVAALTATLAFGSADVGTTSAAQTATLSNSGNAALAIATIASDSADFAVSGGTCAAGGSIAPAGSCTIGVVFKPKAAGARSGNLIVTHNAGSGRSSASLSGTGVALTPAIAVSPTALNFSQTVGTPSTPQTATVSNTGKAPLVINTLTLGGAQAAEFKIDGASTCAAGGSVAVGGSCVLKLVFTAAAVGTRSASLAIGNNASGTPTTIALNGIGTAAPAPAISLSATTLAFTSQALGSTSAEQSVTVSNSGAATLTLAGMTLNGSAAADFTRAGTCSTTGAVAVGASCTVTFTFTPGALGVRSATLTIASDAANGAAVMSLSGTGVAAPVPSVSLKPATLAFGKQTVGLASTARSVTLANTGSGALALSGISTTSGFGVTHGCSASLAPGASCTLSVVFTPTAAGAVTGSLDVTSNAAGSPHAVALSGSGVVSSPVLAWVPAATTLDFGDATVGGTAATRSLTLANQGPGPVTLSEVRLAGANAVDFSLGSGGTCSPVSTLAQGAACTMALAFQPGAAGSRTATLQVVASGTAPPDVALSGNGTAAASPALEVVPTALSFSVAAADEVAPQTVTLKSSGSAVLHVNAVRVASGAFTLAGAAASGCPTAPFDLMPGQDCAIEVGWASTAPGAEAGLIEIESDAGAAPTQVAIQAERAAPPPPEISNVGAGGCSLARGDSLADPTLWLLALAASGVLWIRRRGA
jgi:trimeric autotransporter adhesin